MRYVYLIFIFLVISTISILGFRGAKKLSPPLEVFDDMDRMPKYMPQSESAFFADGRSDRLPVENTVARGTYYEDEYMETGKIGTEFGKGMPDGLEISNALMDRGEDRYNIYCAVCHGQAGNADSIIKKYAVTMPVADLTQPFFVNYPDGQLYDVITNGKGLMFSYADKLSVEDRWAVVLYMRALQRAANGTANDLTPAKREELGL